MNKFLPDVIAIEKSLSFLLMFCLLTVIFITPEQAFADSNTTDAITTTLCNIATRLTGPMARGIATIAMVALGIGLLLGKTSWGMAAVVGIGVGVIFGAPNLVTWLGSSNVAGQVC